MTATVEADSRPGAGNPPARRWLTAIGAALFLPARRQPLRWGAVALAVAAVAVGTAVGLGRTRGPGALNTIWAEDGSILLTGALNDTFWGALSTPLNGYYITAPRLLAEVASWTPVELAAIVLSVEAAVAAAAIALLVYVASGAHLRHPLFRLLVSAPVVVAPVGALFTPHHLVTLQFIALYALFWVLLWVPVGLTGRAVGLVFTALTVLSSILVIALLPLAVLRTVVRRDRHSVALLVTMVAGLVVQFGGLLFGPASRTGISHPRPDPFWALAEYVLWAVPYSVLGQRWLEPGIANQNGYYPTQIYVRTVEHAALVALAWCVVVAILLIALRRITSPAWPLAAVAVAHSIGIFAVEVMGMGYARDGYLVSEDKLIVTDRYLVPAALLLIVAAVALLRPSGVLTRDFSAWPNNAWPVLMYATLVAIVCVANFRHDNPRSKSQPWRTTVVQARAECRDPARANVTVAVGSVMWGNRWPQIVIPCDRLRA